ncbi:MAG: peptidase [Faecousia sp.]
MRMERGARIIVENWLHAQPNDVLHLITDETKQRESEAFFHAARQIGAIPKLSVLPANSIQAGDSIEQMRNIMSYATAIVGATSYSFITTNAVYYALRHGARFLSLPLSTNNGQSLLEQDFLQMDPTAAARMGRPMMRCLRSSDTVRITTKLGTDITFSIRGRKPGLFNGVTARAGVCASASFEVYIPPVETATNGRVILDGSMGYIGLVSQPLELGFTNGYLTYIGSTPDGQRLKAYLEQFGDPEMYCAAELGIGLNKLSQCRGDSYIEDESAYGTFHIGFGRNLALGGGHNAAGHFDIVVHRPTILTGESVLMIDGESCAWFGGHPSGNF